MDLTYVYSPVSAFAINHGQSTQLSLVGNLSSPPTVTPVTPLPWTGQETITETTVATTSTYTDGTYRLNYPTPSCDAGCACTLHVDELSSNGYPRHSASSSSGGTVVSPQEIRFTWRTSGQHAGNDFTLVKLTNLAYGVVWRSYYAGALRVEGDTTPNRNGVHYLLADHLGSTTVTVHLKTDFTLEKLAELRYMPWGENRASGYAETDTPTERRYTGQIKEEIGLYFYQARWYDPLLGRMAQADTVVPRDIQGLDRYAYVFNNPIGLIDPSGKYPCNDFPCRPDKVRLYWYLTIHVSLATSGIPTNSLKAQLNYDPKITGIPAGHSNLCGHIALEMVYETITGTPNMLGPIYRSSGTEFDEGSDGNDLAKAFVQSFPTGWIINHYAGRYITTNEAGSTRNSQHLIDMNWTHGSSDYTRSMMRRMLSEGHYLIALVWIDVVAGKIVPQPPDVHDLEDGIVEHWVVVTGISYSDRGSFVTINNPYNNTKERYEWNYFWKSFQWNLLEIIPAKKKQT